MQLNIQFLTQNQLNLANKVVQVLAPVDEITKSVLQDLAPTSIILPFVRILDRTFEQNEDDTGVRTVKEDDKKLTIATVLDPRFKDKFFTQLLVKEKVNTLVKQEIENLTKMVQRSQPTKRHCVLATYSKLLEEAGVHVSENNESSRV